MIAVSLSSKALDPVVKSVHRLLFIIEEEEQSASQEDCSVCRCIPGTQSDNEDIDINTDETEQASTEVHQEKTSVEQVDIPITECTYHMPHTDDSQELRNFTFNIQRMSPAMLAASLSMQSHE